MKYFFKSILMIFFVSCKFISAGSYPNSEDYMLNISREELIKRINEFKDENPKYKVMTTFEMGNLAKRKTERMNKIFIVLVLL